MGFLGLRSCLILHIHIYSTKKMLKLINFISLCDRKDCNLENVLSVSSALFFLLLALHSLLSTVFSQIPSTKVSETETNMSLLSNNHFFMQYSMKRVLTVKSHVSKQLFFYIYFKVDKKLPKYIANMYDMYYCYI